MALQIRRGPTADREGKVFAEGEIIYDTDLREVFIGDGTTLGGKTVSTYTDNQSKDSAASLFTHNVGHSNVSFAYDSVLKRITATVTLDGTYNDLVLDTTPELGGDLSLNDKNITLSDSTVVINGTTGIVTADVIGNLTGNADTVTDGVYTNQTFFIGETEIGVTRAAGAQTLTGVSIDGNAATVTNGIYNTGDQTITGVLSATAFSGNLSGSVYGTDESTIVNADTNTVTATTVVTEDLTVSGTLIVNGTTTTINSTTLEIADKNITIAKGATTGLEAEGAGITIDGANATILYTDINDSISINKAVESSVGFVGDVTGNVTGNVLGDVTGDLTGNVLGDVTGNVTGDLTGNVLGDVTGNVTGDLTGNVLGDVTGNVFDINNQVAVQVDDLTSGVVFYGDLYAANIRARNELLPLVLDSDIAVTGYAEFDGYVGSGELRAFQKIVGYDATDELNLIEAFSVTTTGPTASVNTTLPVILARLSTTEITAITTPVVGMIVYNTTANKFQGYQGGTTPQWVDLS